LLHLDTRETAWYSLGIKEVSKGSVISFGYLRLVNHHNSEKGCSYCSNQFEYGMPVVTLFRRSGKKSFVTKLHPKCMASFMMRAMAKQIENGKPPRIRRLEPREKDKSRARLLRRRSYLITKLAERDDLSDDEILDIYDNIIKIRQELGGVSLEADHVRDPEKLVQVQLKANDALARKNASIVL